MKRTLVLGTLVLVGALSVAVAAVQQPAARGGGRGPGAAATARPPSADQLVVDRLRDNLFVVRPAPKSGASGGNTAVLVMANGVLLVDTKVPGWGQPLIAKVKEITDKPIVTVINTHTHYDHVGGNVDFARNVEFVTHENTAALMKEMNEVYGRPNTATDVFRVSKGHGLPTRTFRDRLTVGSGNDRVDLYYFGRAHTSGDAFVVFPAARVLHTGDAFPNKGAPIMDINNGGSALEFADTLAKVAALSNIDTVITGHAAATMTLADVKEFSDFNRAFVDAVRAAKKAGQSIDDVVKTWKVPERFLKAGYTQPGEAALRANTEVAWKELN
jgi:glyoxylase-like metal-dependent hydrolase (beta-lactamase superfamily II)